MDMTTLRTGTSIFDFRVSVYRSKTCLSEKDVASKSPRTGWVPVEFTIA